MDLLHRIAESLIVRLRPPAHVRLTTEPSYTRGSDRSVPAINGKVGEYSLFCAVIGDGFVAVSAANGGEHSHHRPLSTRLRRTITGRLRLGTSGALPTVGARTRTAAAVRFRDSIVETLARGNLLALRTGPLLDLELEIVTPSTSILHAYLLGAPVWSAVFSPELVVVMQTVAGPVQVDYHDPRFFDLLQATLDANDPADPGHPRKPGAGRRRIASPLPAAETVTLRLSWAEVYAEAANLEE